MRWHLPALLVVVFEQRGLGGVRVVEKAPDQLQAGSVPVPDLADPALTDVENARTAVHFDAVLGGDVFVQVGGRAVGELDEAEEDALVVVAVLVDSPQLGVGRIAVNGADDPVDVGIAGEHEGLGQLPAALTGHLVAAGAEDVDRLYLADFTCFNPRPGFP